MQIGRLVRQWILPVFLGIVALAAWQAANRADFEPATGIPEAYDNTVQTPVLSARRIPMTLRAPVSDSRIAVPINQQVVDTPFPQSCLSVKNGDRQLGDPHELTGGLVPASNQKLLTTYAAIGLLGPEFTFNTRVTATAEIVDGVVNGDLYLIGDGDPFLYTENWLTQYTEDNDRSHTRLEDLADKVAAEGITSVTGAIYGDESLFDSIRSGPWDSRLIIQQQSGPLSALSVNEGFGDWPEVFSSARVRTESSDPPLDAASVFNQLLGERGVTVSGGPAVGISPPGSIQVASIQSPPLSDTITHINSYSSNIGAELLLKRLGFARLGAGTTEAGATTVTQYLTEQGIPMTDILIFDGSGLAETNRLTCAALAAILASEGPDTVFGRSLSIAGARGSLLSRFKDTPAQSFVLAKTGTLRGVQALAGYVRSATPSDPDSYVTFAYIVNDDTLIEFDVEGLLQTPLMNTLIGYPAGPAVKDLSPLPAIPTQ